jgi:hypothetical protein
MEKLNNSCWFFLKAASATTKEIAIGTTVPDHDGGRRK